MNWQRFSSLDYIGFIIMVLGGLIMAFSKPIFPILNPENVTEIGFIYTFAGFGASIIGAGLGILGLSAGNKATEIAKESDKRMKAIGDLNFHERMGMLEVHIRNIRNNEKPLPNQIYHDVNACVLLQDWISKNDIEMLRTSIRDIVAAAEEYKGTKIWETNQYESMVGKLTQLEKQLKN